MEKQFTFLLLKRLGLKVEDFISFADILDTTDIKDFDFEVVCQFISDKIKDEKEQSFQEGLSYANEYPNR